MDFINIILGFFVGILSSYVFWLALVLTKPNIAISPFAVFYPSDGSLRVRIINKSRRQAVDIKVYLAVDELTPRNTRRTIHTPNLNSDYRFALEPKHKDMDFKWGIPTATTFIAYDGQKILDLLAPSNGPERRLLFTLSATDALSGAKIVQRVSYSHENLRHGMFVGGLVFEVVESNSNESVENEV
ncbi:MAG: hypothetical protein ABTQ25_03515 [Nitrosomonas ureae]